MFLKNENFIYLLYTLMYMNMYNLKDIIRINQEIGETGEIRDNSSIIFALGLTSKSWLYKLSYLVRSLITDHPFIDGNKRTAFVLCTLFFQINKVEYKDELLLKAVYKIAKKNIIDINKIMRELLKCLT